MGSDKSRAKRRKLRIPERTIWIVSILGGMFGVLFAMKYFRHKTQKRIFNIGIPILVLIYSILFVLIFYCHNNSSLVI